MGSGYAVLDIQSDPAQIKFQELTHQLNWCETKDEFFHATWNNMPTWCRYCHQEGHTKFNCSVSKARIICYGCHEHGHRSFECPRRTTLKEPRKNVNPTLTPPQTISTSSAPVDAMTVTSIDSSDDSDDSDYTEDCSGQMSVESSENVETIEPEEVAQVQEDLQSSPITDNTPGSQSLEKLTEEQHKALSNYFDTTGPKFFHYSGEERRLAYYQSRVLVTPDEDPLDISSGLALPPNPSPTSFPEYTLYLQEQHH